MPSGQDNQYNELFLATQSSSHMFQNASRFSIQDSQFMNVQGNVNIYLTVPFWSLLGLQQAWEASQPMIARPPSPPTQTADYSESESYSNQLLSQGQGFPLYISEPDGSLPAEYQRERVVRTHDDDWGDIFKVAGRTLVEPTFPELQQAMFGRSEIMKEGGTVFLRPRSPPLSPPTSDGGGLPVYLPRHYPALAALSGENGAPALSPDKDFAHQLALEEEVLARELKDKPPQDTSSELPYLDGNIPTRGHSISSFPTHMHTPDFIEYPRPGFIDTNPLVSAMQSATCQNLRIRSPSDVRIVFHAVLLNLLPMVTRRLDTEERNLIVPGPSYKFDLRHWGLTRRIQPGSVYVWEEPEARTEITGVRVGIKQWTDGKHPLGAIQAIFSLRLCWRNLHTPQELLIKQKYTAFIDTPRGQRKWHLIAYFTEESVDRLNCIDDYPSLSCLNVPHGNYKSARSVKGRPDA
ncbi:cAMP-independent regulatory protein pac2 [Mycena sanguinolenta]|uniref:cAMP-independent regulatory protein pac2 n=1 Tax=Mycena sanguinolenta TaxID=230812 RepID=A0A8H6ZCX4_9AGAR|nr:cAMP-independent regulatory protein pac2 [Mycena sanguinolenta]